MSFLSSLQSLEFVLFTAAINMNHFSQFPVQEAFTGRAGWKSSESRNPQCSPAQNSERLVRSLQEFPVFIDLSFDRLNKEVIV